MKETRVQADASVENTGDGFSIRRLDVFECIPLDRTRSSLSFLEGFGAIRLRQNTPFRLQHLLARHNAETACRMGWSDLANGDLIAAVKAACADANIIADRGLRHRQNVGGQHLALIVEPGSA